MGCFVVLEKMTERYSYEVLLNEKIKSQINVYDSFSQRIIHISLLNFSILSSSSSSVCLHMTDEHREQLLTLVT